MTLNGETFDIAAIAEPNLIGLIQHLGLSAGRVAIELNGDIIPRNTYAATKISSSDIIEVIHYVGGG